MVHRIALADPVALADVVFGVLDLEQAGASEVVMRLLDVAENLLRVEVGQVVGRLERGGEVLFREVSEGAAVRLTWSGSGTGDDLRAAA